MPRLRFKQVDVFTSRPFAGNPVAVVLNADDVAPTDMLRIARWTNLSETTFLMQPMRPDASYRLRIFSPGGELPFAGHPTIGSAHAALEAGMVPGDATHLTQECAAGLLPLVIEGAGAGRQISVRVPAPRLIPEHAVAAGALSAALGAPISGAFQPLTVDVGPVWLVAQMESVQAVRELDPDQALLTRLSRELKLTGVTVFGLGDVNEPTVQVRSFAPAIGGPEDPVCGSGNASVGAFLAHTGLLRQTGPRYVASQGTEIGRDGHITVQVEDEGASISIGGPAVTVIDGTIEIS
jgi:PhzF family phenazine biosynthesis protein